MYEYYIAQSIVEETLYARGGPIDEEKSVLRLAYLADDLGILTMVAEHVSEMPVDWQYNIILKNIKIRVVYFW